MKICPLNASHRVREFPDGSAQCEECWCVFGLTEVKPERYLRLVVTSGANARGRLEYSSRPDFGDEGEPYPFSEIWADVKRWFANILRRWADWLDKEI